ncbi:MAG: LPS assembly lipoprotein LptE [Chiayiivirga sp.]|jgi:LPS-assembly lipoprotein|uniref:LPS-assembly lipoprotein LptE n=1 Tax=Chiayiivirga sp. TaxID=2041042 RepID=UPI0025C449B2|nr:LPS assembly lipoprotein LptE [Chiayiivirga sp.]MCI1710116.1 LPS assembly lipoprotein LptE [Chiayiivirga sp.]MCI1729085.1 LPS assembly lipoprotein LptE [Chiayiivirga sp.]
MRALLVLAVLILAGCGFHLRQSIALPAELAAIRVEVVDSYSPLQRNLEQALRRSGATLAEGKDASAVLRVFVQRMDRLPLSVGDTGRVQEYLMRYTVEFELVDAQGKAVLQRQGVELERDYTFDTLQALGTPGEEEVVKSELERDMVQTLLRRIDAVSRAG